MLQEHVKNYIEDNINTIDAGDWMTLFKNIPDSIVDNELNIGDILLTAGINFLKDLDEIPEGAFANSRIVDSLQIIPPNIKIIGPTAFWNCSGLSDIVIPQTVHTLSSSSFEGCDNLLRVHITENVKTIGEEAFRSCSSLHSVRIDEGVETILSGAFAECDNLHNVVLPKSIKYIDEDAFAYCGDDVQIHYAGTEEEWEELLDQEQIFTDTTFSVFCKR